MSDTALPVIFRFDTTANRGAFTPTPGVAEQLYIWLDSDDQPNSYFWDGANWVQFAAGAGAAGITQLTGDVTAGPGSGSQAATIANSAVTYAKIQNVSATARILARITAGAGVVEEATLTQVLDLIGGAAQGDIIFRDAAAWDNLAAGTAGRLLQTNGAAANPSWVSFITPLSASVGLVAALPTEPVMRVWKGDGGADPTWITGDVMMLENSGDNFFQFFSPATSVQGISFSDLTRNMGAVFYAHTTDSLGYRVNSANRGFINSSGQFGMGMSAVTDIAAEPTLHVRKGDSGADPAWASDDVALFESPAATSCSIQLFSPATNANTVGFSNPGNRNRGRISYRHNTDAMEFGVAATLRMVLGSGQLGVGSLTALSDIPAEPTIIARKGNAGTDPSWASSDVLLLENTAGTDVIAQFFGTTVQGISFSDTTRNMGAFFYNHADDSLGFRANSANRGFITSAGILGIGMTATTDIPANILVHFRKGNGGTDPTWDANDVLLLENSSDAWLNFFTPATQASGIVFSDTTRNVGAIFYNHSTDALAFRVNSTTRLTITSAGLLQFGTHSAIGAETVTGYITIKDAGGTDRKLAVVS